MNKTVLQIPINITLRHEAEKEALAQGFSSLQEAVRLFLKKLAEKKLSVTFEEPIQLSEKAAKRYDKIARDIENGKVKLYTTKNVDDLMDQLNS